MLINEVGCRIKYLRKTRLMINQDDFAKILDMDRASLSKIESGRSNITLATLEKIMSALKISAKDFFNF